MDMEKLVSEITRKVKQIIDARSNAEHILVITEPAEQRCRPAWEKEYINEAYEVHFAAELQDDSDLGIYQEVIVYDMDIGNLSKLSGGIFDNDYLKIIGKCILRGKKITLIEDDMQVEEFKDVAPNAFMRMIRQKINIVKQWGIEIIREKEVLSRFVAESGNSDKAMSKQEISESQAKLDKKFITERDVEDMYRSGFRELNIREDAKVTDVAVEYAQKRDIILKRLGR